MERLILDDEGKRLIKALGLEEPYALYDKATRLAEGPEDWGDEATIGLFVKRKGEDLGLGNYGQWTGFHDLQDPDSWNGMRPTILLRNWCSGVREPLARPGKPVISALNALVCFVQVLSQEITKAEQCENMRALASRDGLAGLSVFDSVEEMKKQFWLD